MIEKSPRVRFGRDEVRAFESALTCYRIGGFDESVTPEGKQDSRGIRILNKLTHGEEATYEELGIAVKALERIARACHEQTRAEWWQENGAGWISDSQNGLFQPGTIDHYIGVRRTQLDWVVSAARIIYDAMEQLNPTQTLAISDERED